jgi:hypothetical protein
MNVGEQIQITKTGPNSYLLIHEGYGLDNMTWSECLGQVAAIITGPSHTYRMRPLPDILEEANRRAAAARGAQEIAAADTEGESIVVPGENDDPATQG